MLPKLLLSLVLFSSYVIVDCESVNIGKYITTCSRNSDDTNVCLVDAVRGALPLLSDGIPELGVEPIDPFHEKELRFVYNKHQINSILVMKNYTVQGVKEAKVRKARLQADDEHFHLEIDMYSPRIVASGYFHGLATHNALKINTTGTFNCTMHDLVYTWKLDGKPEIKNNVTYMKIYDFYMRPDVGKMQATATTDDPELKPIFELANNFVKDNWKILYREMLPYAQASWKKSGIHVSNAIFMKVPYDQLFPIKS